jgi:hypothetical protein
MVTLINLNDHYSRARLLSFPCGLGRERVERHPATEDYQLALRLAFAKWGLPDRLAVDHDSVFPGQDRLRQRQRFTLSDTVSSLASGLGRLSDLWSGSPAYRSRSDGTESSDVAPTSAGRAKLL